MSVSLALEWVAGLELKNGADSPAIDLHSSKAGVPSPTQALAYAVMGCMAMDVIFVLQKGRHTLHALTVRFDGERAPKPPTRFVRMALHFDVRAEVSDAVIERAIDLSKTKYCSVWHTIRQDVELTTSFTLLRGDE